MHDNPDEPGMGGLALIAARLDELETLFGTKARPAIARLRASLLEALAARDRGDAPGALRSLRGGMDELARVVDDVDPQEAASMKILAAALEGALGRGEGDAARRIATDMLRRSGAEKRNSGASGDPEES